METNILHNYIYEIQRLRISKAHGNAPHQPILLLSIIELIEQGQISENKIIPSPRLVETFISISQKSQIGNPGLNYPFSI